MNLDISDELPPSRPTSLQLDLEYEINNMALFSSKRTLTVKPYFNG